MDEHSVAIVSFEGAIKREVQRIRQKLLVASNAGLLLSNYLYLSISAKGRITDGEIKIQFTLYENEYASNPVNGNSSQTVTEEFLRRAGWQKVNDPIAISFTKTEPPLTPGAPYEDEIPF